MKKCVLSFVFMLFFFAFLLGGSYNPQDVEIVLTYQNEKMIWTDKLYNNSQNFEFSHNMQKYNRQKGHKERFVLIEKIVNMGFSLEDAFDFTFPKLKNMIDDFSKKIERPKVDATVEFFPDSRNMFVYTDEKMGYEVEKEKLYEKLFKGLKEKNKIKFEVEPKKIFPSVTKKELQKKTKLTSCFETDYSHSSENRKTNVRLALKCFNGLILKPNTNYSFNKITGKRTEEKGYKEANIILNNEYVEGFGGGVCQVSTTLYNALLLADIKILESHPHSLESSYVLNGFDAMVNYGLSDLQFFNDKNYPLYIKTYFDDKKIGVKIYGEKLPYVIKRKFEIMSETNLEEVVLEDETMCVGEQKYKTFPKTGKKIKTFLEYYKNGKIIKSKPLRTQTYKPVQGVKLVGTKQSDKVKNETFTIFEPII